MSDQADKAAESIRVWKANYSETGKLRGGPCVWLYNPKGEAVVLMFPQDRPEAEGVVSEIVNGLNASLIRSHTAPRELVEQLADELERTRSGFPSEYEIYKCLIDSARAALSAQEPKVCVHKYTPYDNTWATECGTVIDDNDSDARWKFCPNCGGVIKVKE